MTRLAVCGGVYANPDALWRMVADARRRGCDRIICLGDLGGFGAEPDEVFPALVQNGIECIAGNYDLAIGSGAEDCGCGYSDPRDNEYAQVMYDLTRERTSPEFAAWMRDLPLELRERVDGVDVHCVHGSPLAVNDFFWESLPEHEARRRVAASGADLLLCTHTGIPWQRRISGTLVVNVGTLGRSANDGTRRGWYAVVDLEGGQARAELIPVSFDWMSHAAGMRQAGLPEPFAQSVESGWWTTCLEVLPARERSRGRYQLYRDSLPEDLGGGPGWGGADVPADRSLPVAPLFGSAAFPSRLWIYTNFHCNLACSYCVVASSPAADPRSIGATRLTELVDEAVAEGFREVFLTGGEPFIEPEIAGMIRYAAERLPTTVLTNAMLFTGRRAADLASLAGLAGLTLQTSLDGARPETHDACRGAGSWERTVDGIRRAVAEGLRVTVATTETEANAGEIERIGDLLEEIGVARRDHAVRPLIARGFSRSGMAVDVPGLVPELTASADGLWWHPVGADRASGVDMLVADGPLPLGEAKRRIVERVIELRQADGTLARPYACAIPVGARDAGYGEAA
jgi:pyruvate-formate lyase-activating enzyme/predicted phosphodiesterase